MKGKNMFGISVSARLNSEDGMVLISTMVILLILTISGIAAITISNNEASIVRNEQMSASEFYDAETGLNDARLNYRTWMTDTFLSTDETTASSTLDSLSVDGDGNSLATLQIRCIEDNNGGSVTPIFNNVADEIPAMSHTASPGAGSGYSARYFQIRRYGITSTSKDGNTVLQIGAWKVFNKY